MYLELEHLNKSFGEKSVVNDLSLSLEQGKLLCLLGESGCGKTTTLKMIGGFLNPDGGDIRIDGQSILGMPPEKRPVSTVFQSYALFPHLNVLDNVIYGLKFQKIKKKDARRMGMEYLEAVGMQEYAKAPIYEISGGQQQRVALIRSLITKPKVLLLDEPLSNLDAKLRVKMREEIRDIQQQFGITMVFVTHDQEEAMVLADEIAIMDKGKLVQIGKPEKVYVNPQNDFARDFLGISNHFIDNRKVERFCRPEELVFADAPISEGESEASVSEEVSTSGVVVKSEFLGFYRQYQVKLDDGTEVIVRTGRDVIRNVGDQVELKLHNI